MSISSVSISPFQSTSSLGAARPQPAEGPSFGSVLSGVAGDLANVLKTGEAAALAGIEGRASVQEVVMKTLAAEQSLQSAISIRDKLVSALNDITHMQI